MESGIRLGRVSGESVELLLPPPSLSSLYLLFCFVKPKFESKAWTGEDDGLFIYFFPYIIIILFCQFFNT